MQYWTGVLQFAAITQTLHWKLSFLCRVNMQENDPILSHLSYAGQAVRCQFRGVTFRQGLQIGSQVIRSLYEKRK